MAFSSGPACGAYQLVLDGEDSAFRVKSGTWALDKTGSYQGNYRFSAVKGAGNSLAVWNIDAIPDGTYLVEYYVDTGDYAFAAEYGVEHDAGVTTVTRSQHNRPAGWYSIGSYSFTGAGRITQTDRWVGVGTKVIADALRITLQSALPVAPPANSVAPEVSIVVDDLGALNPTQNGTFTHTLFTQAPDITYAVLPGLTYTNAVMSDSNSKGIETMLHQPMEYYGLNPDPSLDPKRLYVANNSSEIISRLNTNLESLAPYIWGMNNHQGSLFSQYRTGLEVALGEIRNRNFYFLDSRTISDSVSYTIAKEKGILAAERDLFVDGSSQANTEELIKSVAQRAIYAPNYNYVMICHQRPETVPGILTALVALETSGVAIRRLDHNLHYIMEVDNVPAGASVNTTGFWNTTTLDMISHELSDGDALVGSNSSAGSVAFTPNLPNAGYYRVFIGAGYSSNLGNTQISINHNSGTDSKVVNFNAVTNRWAYIGRYGFDAGAGANNVTLNRLFTFGGNVTADAVKFVYDGALNTEVEDWTDY